MREPSDKEFPKLRLPIGEDDYQEVIKKECFYIDKTLLIKEFWENGSKVFWVTRPRRFGKSMALSMLRYFFEKPAFEKPAFEKPAFENPVSAKTEQSTAYLFEKSNIWKEEKFRDLQGTYPVIFISFKDIKGTTWEKAYAELQELLKREVKRTLKPLLHLMDEDSKSTYMSLINKTANEAEFNGVLFFITEIFKEIYGKNTIVLIDEYDSPITHAYIYKFYEPMVNFMRQTLSKALKSNNHLEKGFLTGVVRTAKDGILSGLNNPNVYTMTAARFADKFGFTESETDDLLEKAGHLDKKEELKSWYNGYVIGEQESSQVKVYNPWSVLQYLDHSCAPKPYWARTGSVDLLERLIREADESTQKDLKCLLEDNVLENKQINEDVILLDLDTKNVEPWSFLFFAGYITATKHVFRDKKYYYTLAIPNQEIAELYKDLVIGVLNQTFDSARLSKLMEALILGNVLEVESLLKEFILSLCSFYDLPSNDLERSLHMFVLGLLASLSERYVIKSNLESGTGRYDVLMHPKRAGDLAVIIEFKKGKNLKLEKLATQALEQIKSGKYESNLRDFGYKGKVLHYGIACYKKHLVAQMEISTVA